MIALGTAAALGVCLTLAGAPAVTVLPLTPDAGVSKKQARGVEALLRERLDDSEFLKVLPAHKRDAREAFRCGKDPGCLSRLAYARGADLLAAGVVSAADDGYRVRLLVVTPDGPLREVEEPVIGTREDMSAWLDRLIRRAFKPEALAGGLYIKGEPAGARVLVDGAVAGVLPFNEALEGVGEGEHTLRVEHPGYVAFERKVDVRFREVTTVDVVLRAERRVATAAERGEAAPTSTGALGGPWAALGASGAAALALSGGALFGTLAFLDQLEVERRARAQQLFLPRDQGLLQRGDAFAWTANGLYALAAVLAATAAGLYVADVVTTPPENEAPAYEGPADGAPASDEMRPRIGP